METVSRFLHQHARSWALLLRESRRARYTTALLFGAGLYVSLWSFFFIFRVLATIEATSASYSDHEYQALLCFGNKSIVPDDETLEQREMRTKFYHGFSKECDRARHRVSTPLWREALFTAWNSSTPCGSAPCMALVFGADETLTALVLRTAALVSALILIGVATQALSTRITRQLGFDSKQSTTTPDKENKSKALQHNKASFPLLTQRYHL